MGDTSRKRNLSFSISLDLDSIENAVSSDSDTEGLQIDEIDSLKNPEQMKTQVIVESPTFINEMEEEIERQLDAKAAKSNLTATNVKNILKHVISNEHVREMFHQRLTNGEDSVVFEPKLTRAKAKYVLYYILKKIVKIKNILQPSLINIYFIETEN